MKVAIIRASVVVLLVVLGGVVAWWLLIGSGSRGHRVRVSSVGPFTHYSFPRFTPDELGAKVNLRSLGTDPNWVRAIALDKPDMWVGTCGSGLWRMNMETGRWENVTTSLAGRSRDLVGSIATEAAAVWVLAGGEVVNRYDKASGLWTSFELEQSDLIRSLATRAGRVVAASWNGVFCSESDPPQFTSLCEKGKECEFGAPCHVGDEALWATWREPMNGLSKRPQAYRHAGVARYDFGQSNWQRFGPGTGIDLAKTPRRETCEPGVTCIVPDGEDLWVGAYDHGAFRYDHRSGKWTHVLREERAPFSARHCARSIVVSTRRVYFVPYWITCGRGVDMPDDPSYAGQETLTAYDKQAGQIEAIPLPKRLAINCAAVDGETVWFGTVDRSVWTLNEAADEWQEMLHGGSPAETFRAIYTIAVAGNRVAIGAGDGLYVLTK